VLPYFSLGILSFALGAQVILRFLVNRGGKKYAAFQQIKVTKYIFILSIFLIFSALCFQSYQQYQIWSGNELSKYLLPPHQNINYFIFYITKRFFAPHLISLAAGLLFLFAAKKLNQKYQERFFYAEEYHFGALAIFLVSHPGWIFYCVFVILLYLLIHIFSFFISRFSSPRLPLHYLWLPAAIFVIIVSGWLQDLTLWSLLKV